MNSSTFRSLFAFSLFSFPSKKKLWQCGIVLSLAFIVIPTFALRIVHRSHAASTKRQSLTFEDRVAAQRAIEEVYHRHRLWPRENPQPKPPLDEMLPEAAIRAKVEDYLRKSSALETYWQRAVTPDELQAEVDRMARNTHQPDTLRELWAALGNDPAIIAECLARPRLIEQALRERYATDERFHGDLRRRAQAELSRPATSGERREVVWRLASGDADDSQFAVRNPQLQMLDAEQWRAQIAKLQRIFGAERFNPQSAFSRGRNPQWSALQEDDERFYAVMILEQSAERVKAAMVEWRKTPFDEWWSGVRGQMEMAALAGDEYRLPEIAAVAAPCGGDAWTATSTTGAPSERLFHTAVWTGSEMIVWGGSGGGNTGGRYNPATDSWTANVTTTGAPNGRYGHSAVWTGSEMIIWGGFNPSNNSYLNTGGRYNLATNSWTANVTTAGAPSARQLHTAVWTGSEMIVWGGDDGSIVNTGRRYNPATDSWTANTTTTGAPSPRFEHSAVWTGSEMIVWGGASNGTVNTGKRYNPATDTWTADITTTGAPIAREAHTAVWTGSEMIVWGGNPAGNTGKRYNLTMDSWTANTTTTGAPSSRAGHTAIWTGNEMIIWSGTNGGNTGGRYSITPPLTISSTTQSFAATGGTGSVNVTAQGGCTWTATSNANWLTISAGSSGAGNGAVAFSVAANTLGPRTGILTIGTQSFIVRQAGVATPRVVRAVTAGSAPGTISVPLEIVSQGDENALGFTLSFDPAVLGNPQVALGADAAGAQLATNTNQTAQGRLGIGLALAAGQKFAAGTRQFAVVTFTTPANLTSGTAQIDFDDLPSAREVSDVTAGALPAVYQGGSISIVAGLEADVAPRPQGNGSLSITDWVQIGRLVAGLDTAAAGIEFQRADCAPRDTRGNGSLTISDWVQAGRYATGADSVTAAAGPNVSVSPSSFASIERRAAGSGQPAVNARGSRVSARWQPATERQSPTIITIELDAVGTENALGFSLQFDPGAWSFVSATAGRDAARASLHVNASVRGRVGVALALAPGQRLAAGARQIVVVQLTARGVGGAIEFSDYPIQREVADAEAHFLPTAFLIERKK